MKCLSTKYVTLNAYDESKIYVDLTCQLDYNHPGDCRLTLIPSTNDGLIRLEFRW